MDKLCLIWRTPSKRYNRRQNSWSISSLFKADTPQNIHICQNMALSSSVWNQRKESGRGQKTFSKYFLLNHFALSFHNYSSSLNSLKLFFFRTLFVAYYWQQINSQLSKYPLSPPIHTLTNFSLNPCCLSPAKRGIYIYIQGKQKFSLSYSLVVQAVVVLSVLWFPAFLSLLPPNLFKNARKDWKVESF